MDETTGTETETSTEVVDSSGPVEETTEQQPAEEWGDIDNYFASKTPVPRPGFPSDFEGIAAYLASDASSFHTGDTIVIDGGSLITG